MATKKKSAAKKNAPAKKIAAKKSAAKKNAPVNVQAWERGESVKCEPDTSQKA